MRRLTAWGGIFVLAMALSFIAPAFGAGSALALGSMAPSVGDIVYFGHYSLSGCSDGQEPIEWIVLDAMDGKLLLLSKDGLETGPYNSVKQRATWADCSLRDWLNCDFLNTAFTFDDQESIMETTVTTPGGCFTSPATGENILIASCPDTQDLVFLLSVDEVSAYFPKAGQRKARNTDYLLGKPESTMPFPAVEVPCDFAYSNWWLRDVREDKGIKSGFHVKSYGKIASGGQVNLKRYVIRPAMWVDAAFPFEIAD